MQEAGFCLGGGGQGLGMCIHSKKKGEEDERWRVDSQVLLLSLGLASFPTSHHLLPASYHLCGHVRGPGAGLSFPQAVLICCSSPSQRQCSMVAGSEVSGPRFKYLLHFLLIL